MVMVLYYAYRKQNYFKITLFQPPLSRPLSSCGGGGSSIAAPSSDTASSIHSSTSSRHSR
jgi:hypothetical protein